MRTSVEKPKTDCHDAARASQLFGGLKLLEIFSALREGSVLTQSDVYSILVRILGAAPIFLFVKLLWLSESAKVA